MPILNFHLTEGRHTAAQHERLLREGSTYYAEVLESPIERVRAFVTLHRPELVALAGVPGAGPAPYFTFLVLEGRPVEQRQRLLEGLTDLVVDVLGVDRDLVRGHCLRVEPQDWAIGGVPASLARRHEIQARAEQGELQ